MTDRTRTAESALARAEPKLGLALSGGGFRAAFFHLGVLARMAETGLLRQVEVISTVSGGSIIGAVLYLRLKDLLENVPDADITDEHYVRIVKHIEGAFLAGVQTHIRARAFADLGKNWKMRKPDYSRSDRLGELYDSTFYQPAWDNSLFGEPRPRTDGPIEMRGLRVAPRDHPGPFDPETKNEGRNARVPVLVVNATSLNTGHNWRFEASRMGEHPRDDRNWVEVDKNRRLGRERWNAIAKQQRDFELGLAVAASACVPALFHPLAVSDLFRDERDGQRVSLRVELVDGGVHDNQGVGALVDQRCQHLMVSDASGQMEDVEEPSTRIPAVAGRSASIQGDRVREEQLIGARRERQLALVHLTKGLPARVVAPIGADGQPLEPPRTAGEIDYSVHPKVQELLARVRTDLDSFTDIEAYSLALYGYRMTARELGVESGVADLARAEPLEEDWEFERLGEQLESAPPAYCRHLEIASERFAKSPRLALAAGTGIESRAVLLLGVLGLVLLALAAIAVWAAVKGLYYLARALPVTKISLSTAVLLIVLGVVLAAVVTGSLVALYLKPRFESERLRRLSNYLYARLVPGLLAPVFFLVAQATLWLNKTFLRAGRLDVVLGYERSHRSAEGEG